MMANVPPQQDTPLVLPASAVSRKMRILLIEDLREAGESIRNALREYCFVDVELDAQKAYSHYRPGFYDLILIDYNTRDMDGYQFYRNIRSIDQKTRVCLITAHAETMGREQGVAILKKPFDKATLFATISRILEQ